MTTATIEPSLNWLHNPTTPKPRKALPVTKSPPKHLRKAIIHKVEQLSKVKENQDILAGTITLDMVRQAMGASA